jgi:hypothetical protein
MLILLSLYLAREIPRYCFWLRRKLCQTLVRRCIKMSFISSLFIPFLTHVNKRGISTIYVRIYSPISTSGNTMHKVIKVVSCLQIHNLPNPIHKPHTPAKNCKRQAAQILLSPPLRTLQPLTLRNRRINPPLLFLFRQPRVISICHRYGTPSIAICFT